MSMDDCWYDEPVVSWCLTAWLREKQCNNMSGRELLGRGGLCSPSAFFITATAGIIMLLGTLRVTNGAVAHKSKGLANIFNFFFILGKLGINHLRQELTAEYQTGSFQVNEHRSRTPLKVKQTNKKHL